MRGFSSSDDNQPLFHFQGHPVYGATALIAGYVATMLVCTLLLATKATGVLTALAFDSGLVLKHGALWQVFTYPVVNAPSIGFVFSMLGIWWFGRDLEKFFGRTLFLQFHLGMLLLLATTGLLLHPLRPVQLAGVGDASVSFSMFLAFATLYPNVPILFSLLSKVVAAIAVAIFTLIALANRDWVGLVQLWVVVGYAYGFVRWQQGRLELPKLSFAFLRRKPKLSVVRPAPVSAGAAKPARRTVARPEPEPAGEPMEEIDALLDKIAQGGINSLTAKERAKLEQAREALLRKQR